MTVSEGLTRGVTEGLVQAAEDKELISEGGSAGAGLFQVEMPDLSLFGSGLLRVPELARDENFIGCTR